MKKPQAVMEIKVGLSFGTANMPVGRLAMRERQIYFEYDGTFLRHGLEISPFHLPLKAGLFRFDRALFEGLPGVFNDSLPDGWGRLLFDRFARSRGVLPADITPLERLAHVGLHGMGALIYEPEQNAHETNDAISLDSLAEQARAVLDGTANDVLQELLALNGSSAGARPKALIGLDATRQHIVHGVQDLPAHYEHWLVKFSNNQDGADAGAIEYVYALMAKEAGISMPEVHLFPATRGAGYFATKRFDREGEKRLHTHTACGLLHTDFRTPALDYEELLALSGRLTRDIREVEKMYRLAVFNVLAHNRDDHAKNFSFLMNAGGQWHLSPAYDLNFSSGPGGEQSTTVMGEGRNPGIDHLLALGGTADIAKTRLHEIIEQTLSALSRWPELAREYGVSAMNTKLIAERIKTS